MSWVATKLNHVNSSSLRFPRSDLERRNLDSINKGLSRGFHSSGFPVTLVPTTGNEGNIGQVNKDEPLAQDFTPAVRFSSRPFFALVGERRTSAGEDHR